MTSNKKLRLSKPLSLSEIEDLYENTVLKQEFYTAEYASEWLKNTEPYKKIARYIKDNLNPKEVLDIGCGIGNLVRELRNLDIDAYGLEFSKDFINLSPVKDYIYTGDVLSLDKIKEESFDLVICMEVLEHIPPTYLDKAIKELKRISKDYLLITIPSYGPNEFGYCGLPLNKECWLRDAKENIPFKNLVVDESNIPHLGHISLATYKWWTLKFLKNGLIRDINIENIGYRGYNFLKYRWNLYILKRLAENGIHIENNNYYFNNLYNVENWGSEIGYIRWTKKEFNLFLKSTLKNSNIVVEFFSGPPEVAFDRNLKITAYELVEEKNLELHYMKNTQKNVTIEPNKWYTVELKLNLKFSDILKIKFGLDKDFIPDYLIKNGDNREIGVALKSIRLLP